MGQQRAMSKALWESKTLWRCEAKEGRPESGDAQEGTEMTQRTVGKGIPGRSVQTYGQRKLEVRYSWRGRRE